MFIEPKKHIKNRKTSLRRPLKSAENVSTKKNKTNSGNEVQLRLQYYNKTGFLLVFSSNLTSKIRMLRYCSGKAKQILNLEIYKLMYH